ncbi:MAG: hypothetical protein JXE07_03370 [Candidatus Aminicenantes bacterium]|nr:hypothetical protein [Candidatus Aminicenantes bacterium]
MGKSVRMKPVQVWMIVFTGVLIAALVVGRIFFGEPGFYWVFGSIQILMALIHLTVLFRTGSPIYLIPTAMYTLWWLTFFPPFAGHPLHEGFALASAAFLAAFIGVLISRRIEWRYKEILQLAARPVTGAADGFTSRPFPAGQAEFSREEAAGLARFLRRNVIAFPFFEPDRVVLVAPEYMWAYLLFFKRTYEKGTYVAFSDSGQVTVRIAKADYRKYEEELTFDQLCDSLGRLFKTFLQWHKEGTPEKIIQMINSARRGQADEK